MIYLFLDWGASRAYGVNTNRLVPNGVCQNSGIIDNYVNFMEFVLSAFEYLCWDKES